MAAVSRILATMGIFMVSNSNTIVWNRRRSCAQDVTRNLFLLVDETVLFVLGALLQDSASL